ADLPRQSRLTARSASKGDRSPCSRCGLRGDSLGFPSFPGPFIILACDLSHSHGRAPLMRRIAILNQKGGVGKPTPAFTLPAALPECGRRVCVPPPDPQPHATTHLGIEPDGSTPSMYDVLVNSKPLSEVRTKVADNLWVAGSDINLAAAEVELAGVVGREVILRDLLSQDEAAFDFVIMDCGPSLGVLTLN